jgi:sugar lactone lactonase YvrE
MPCARADWFVCSDGTASVKRYTDKGDYLGDFVLPGAGGMDGSRDLVFGPDGNLYVTDPNLGRVLEYDGTTGEFLRFFASGQSWSYGLTFGPDGNLYVCSEASGEVFSYDGSDGKPLGTFATCDELLDPTGLVFGSDTNLYVCDSVNNHVLRFDGTSGNLIDIFASCTNLTAPRGLTFGPDGNLYVASTESGEVLRFDGQSGEYLGIFAAGPELTNPHMGLKFGPDGNLYVCDNGNDTVLCYDGQTGALIGDATGPLGDLSAPTGLVYLAVSRISISNTPTFFRSRNVPLRIPVADLLTNVANPDAAALHLDGVAPASTNGAVLYGNSAYVLYGLPPGGNVEDAFTFTVSDNIAAATGTVRIAIQSAPASTNCTLATYSLINGKPAALFAGIPGYAYRIQRTQDLSGTPQWTDLLTTNAPPGGLFQYVDPNPPLGSLFYRAQNQ